MRFSRGIDRFDRALMLSAFHPDAIDDHGEFVGTPEQLFDFSFGNLESRSLLEISDRDLLNRSAALASFLRWLFGNLSLRRCKGCDIVGRLSGSRLLNWSLVGYSASFLFPLRLCWRGGFCRSFPGLLKLRIKIRIPLRRSSALSWQFISVPMSRR